MDNVYTTAGKRRQLLYIECDNGQRTQVHTIAQATEFARQVKAKTFTVQRYKRGEGYTEPEEHEVEVPANG